MSAAEMTERIAATSPRFKARMAGFFYLLMLPVGGLAVFARRGLAVNGDAAATATNILAHEPLFRLGFAGDLLVVACYIAVTALFYDLFKPVIAGGGWAQILQALLLGPLLSLIGSKKFFIAKPNKTDLVLLKDLLAAGKIVPVIDRRYPLSDVAEALRYLGEGHAQGKVVITVEHSNDS
jgi:hypothetical protein